VFQPVPESKAGKVRIHLDAAVDDIDEGIDLVTSLGGHLTGERHDYEDGAVVVMTIRRTTSFARSSTTHCLPPQSSGDGAERRGPPAHAEAERAPQYPIRMPAYPAHEVPIRDKRNGHAKYSKWWMPDAPR
jgi:Glyoxalase-like domain